jgi:hypothetical protein
MRFKGIHILDGFPCFLTTAHSKSDIDKIISNFRQSISELKEVGLIPVYGHSPVEVKNTANSNDLNTPPVPNARLGRDKDGNPAWFIKDEKNPGKYLQVQVQ